MLSPGSPARVCGRLRLLHTGPGSSIRSRYYPASSPHLDAVRPSTAAHVSPESDRALFQIRQAAGHLIDRPTIAKCVRNSSGDCRQLLFASSSTCNVRPPIARDIPVVAAGCCTQRHAIEIGNSLPYGQSLRMHVQRVSVETEEALWPCPGRRKLVQYPGDRGAGIIAHEAGGHACRMPPPRHRRIFSRKPPRRCNGIAPASGGAAVWMPNAKNGFDGLNQLLLQLPKKRPVEYS